MYVIGSEGTLLCAGGIDDQPRVAEKDRRGIPSYVGAALCGDAGHVLDLETTPVRSGARPSYNFYIDRNAADNVRSLTSPTE